MEQEDEASRDTRAVGGLVGAAEDSEEETSEVPDTHQGMRDELGPFIRSVIRDEMRGLLDLHPMPGPSNMLDNTSTSASSRRRPAPVMVEQDGVDDYPLGRGAVPRRSALQADEEIDFPNLRGSRSVDQQGSGSSASEGTSRAYQERVFPRDPQHHTPDRNGHDHPGPQPMALKEDLSIKVKPFDPKEVDWFAYRAHFLSMADQAGWSSRTRTTRLMSALQGSMAGVTAGLPQPITFQSLLSSVDGIYGLSNAREDAALRLQNLRMEGEGVSIFAERVRQLVIRAYPTYTAIDREEQALRVFLQGLPTRGDFRMQMRMRGFTTLREAVEYGSRLEQVLKDEKSNELRKPHVRGAGVESSDLAKSVEKLTSELSKIQQNQGKQWELLKGLQNQSGSTAGKGHGAPRQGQMGGPLVGAGHGAPNANGHGGPRDAQYPPAVDPNQCRYCLEYGHWARDCPKLHHQGNNPGGNQGGQRRPQGPSN